MSTFTHLEWGGSCEIIVDRRIDGEAANLLEIDLLAITRLTVQTVYINLAACTFICSAGIRVLLQYHRNMKKEHKSLLVSRVSTEVDTILELTGFRESLLEKNL
jgi:anti-anti-sigma factor